MTDPAATYTQGWLSAPSGTPYFPVAELQQRAMSKGIQSFGEPSFAFWKQSAGGSFSGFGEADNVALLLVALDAVPVRYAADDEPHWLFSLHGAESGREAFSIGVTPSLRICAQVTNSNVIYTPPGVIAADHKWRLLQLQVVSHSVLELRVDGVLMVRYTAGVGVSLNTRTIFADHYELGRVMLFNGGSGLTKCACTIYGAGYVLSQDSTAWPLTEGVGFSAYASTERNLWGFTAVNLPSNPADLPDSIVPDPSPGPDPLPDPEPPGDGPPQLGPFGDMTLTAGWFDPTPGQPQPYPLSAIGLAKAFRWVSQARYRKGVPLSPAYDGAGGVVTGYDPVTGASIDTTLIDVVHTQFHSSGPPSGGYSPSPFAGPGIYVPFPHPRKL